MDKCQALHACVVPNGTVLTMLPLQSNTVSRCATWRLWASADKPGGCPEHLGAAAMAQLWNWTPSTRLLNDVILPRQRSCIDHPQSMTRYSSYSSQERQLCEILDQEVMT